MFFYIWRRFVPQIVVFSTKEAGYRGKDPSQDGKIWEQFVPVPHLPCGIANAAPPLTMSAASA
jgi:hypothetical protein